jgi:hypothetical protein
MRLIMNKMGSVSFFFTAIINTMWLPRKYFRISEYDSLKTNPSVFRWSNNVPGSKSIKYVADRKQRTNHKKHPVTLVSEDKKQ